MVILKSYWSMHGTGIAAKIIRILCKNMGKKMSKELLYKEYTRLVEKIDEKKKLYIYGAGIVAYGAYVAILELLNKSPEAFLVSDTEENPNNIAGIPVRSLAEVKTELCDCYILIATPEEYHNEIVCELENIKKTYVNIVEEKFSYEKLTSHLEYVLMGEYLKQKKNLKRVEEIPASDVNDWYTEKDNITVYMATSHKDRELKEKYQQPGWVKRIQVGAALTDERIANITDYDIQNGTRPIEQISFRNSLYGELTATYWMWKNTYHSVTGLFHYRRVLEIDVTMLKALEAKEIDAILPLPFVCYPNAAGQYGRYLNDEDLQVLWDILQIHEKERFEQIKEIIQDKYLYNYNIVVARNEVFRDYCEWMFPILMEVEERCEAVERLRLPRYIGRVGEVLTSVYFTLNCEKWNIVHAEKRWLI